MSESFKDIVLPILKERFKQQIIDTFYKFPNITLSLKNMYNDHMSTAFFLEIYHKGSLFATTTVTYYGMGWGTHISDTIEKIISKSYTNFIDGSFNIEKFSLKSLPILHEIHSQGVGDKKDMLINFPLTTLLRKRRPSTFDTTSFSLIKDMSYVQYEDSDCIVLRLFHEDIKDDIIFVRENDIYKLTTASNKLYRRKMLSDQLST